MKNTGVRIGITWMAIAAVLLAVWLGGAALAQREGPMPGRPGPMQPMQGPPIIMKAGSGGVFVLMGNVLTKYDAGLAQKGSVKLDVQPSEPQNMQRPMPPPPTFMLLSPGANEKVLVLIGDQFFSVNAESLAIAARAKLPPLPMMQPPPGDNPNPPDNGGDQPGVEPGRPPMRMAPMGPPMPGGLELQGNVLYVLHGPQIVGVNINDGSIVGPAPLPKPPAPEEGK